MLGFPRPAHLRYLQILRMLLEFCRNPFEQLLIFEDLQPIGAVVLEGDDAGISFDVDAF